MDDLLSLFDEAEEALRLRFNEPLNPEHKARHRRLLQQIRQALDELPQVEAEIEVVAK